jgi:hypothetical protein
VDGLRVRWCRDAVSELGAAMRDWILVLAPIGAAIYFIFYPADFWTFIEWGQHLLFH